MAGQPAPRMVPRRAAMRKPRPSIPIPFSGPAEGERGSGDAHG